MLKEGTVVATRLLDKKWVVAQINSKGKLTRKKSISKLADVKDQGFITLASWLKLTKSTEESQSVMNDLGCTSLYIQYEEAVNPDSKGVKQWEKTWWLKFNDYCNGCKKKCKQSSHTQIYSCNQYTPVGK